MSEKNDYQELETLSAQEILKWAAENFGTEAVFTSSFGAEDMAIMDMLFRGNLNIGVATIDTGRLPGETYELMDRAREKYGVEVRAYFPDYREVESMVERNGMNLFYRSVENRKLCCHVRKVEPLNRILEGRRAWITGLRSDQTAFRRNASKVEVDTERKLLKINPLLNWTSGDVWNYIKENNVPYNTLHDRGYPSIGCSPCTRAVRTGEDERAGRWWWESDVKECGLHVREEGVGKIWISRRANPSDLGKHGGA